LPYLAEEIWKREEIKNCLKISNVFKVGDVVVFSKEKVGHINHYAICIENDKFLSKECENITPEETDFLDIVERYEDTRYIEKIRIKYKS